MSQSSNNLFFAQDAALQSGATANGNGTAMNVGGAATVGVEVTGTFGATVNFEGTVDGSNWYSLTGVNKATLNATTSPSAPGLYSVDVAGCDQFRARVSGYTSGSVSVTAKVLQQASSLVAATLNTAQWGGYAVQTGGVNGSVGVGGLAASGSAVAGNPVLVAGWDGTNARTLSTDSSGVQKIGRVPVGTPLAVGSANAAAANNQTLAGTAGKTTYITGFDISGLGATAGSTITVTVTGLANTLTYYYTVPAGVSTAAPTWNVRFDPPIPASATNTAVVVNVPSFGAGNTTAAVNAFGFQL